MDIHYHYVPAIPLEQRVKNWSVSPSSMLERLEVLAEKGKLCKKELLPIMRTYVKEHKWEKEHSKRFGALLKSIKNKTNHGRYVLRWLEYCYSHNCNPDMVDVISKFQYVYQRIRIRDLDRYMLRDVEWSIEMREQHFARMSEYLYIGPVRCMIWSNEDGRVIGRYVSIKEQFPYEVNAHGEYISE